MEGDHMERLQGWRVSTSPAGRVERAARACAACGRWPRWHGAGRERAAGQRLACRRPLRAALRVCLPPSLPHQGATPHTQQASTSAGRDAAAALPAAAAGPLMPAPAQHRLQPERCQRGPLGSRGAGEEGSDRGVANSFRARQRRLCGPFAIAAERQSLLPMLLDTSARRRLGKTS